MKSGRCCEVEGNRGWVGEQVVDEDDGVCVCVCVWGGGGVCDRGGWQRFLQLLEATLRA
jgi:hypothetical protein